MYGFLRRHAAWLVALPLVLLAGCFPSADFTADFTEGDAPLAVEFTDQSKTIALFFINTTALDPIQSWDWDYGDGGTSTLKDPSHTFQTEGTYTVTLTVRNLLLSDTLVRQDFITVGPDPGIPVAAFQVSVNEGSVPLTVQFTDTSIEGTEPIIAWRWDFGDDSISTQQNPSHTYTSIGVYNVSLTVESSIGVDTRTESDVIRVRAAAPAADFSATGATGDAPLTVQFADASNPGSEAITSWLWSFGDGATSIEANPGHTYAQSGVYTVSLTVTSSVGSDTETKADFVTVNALQGPTASFTASPTSGDVPLVVSFTDASTAGSRNITNRLWDFGDGATSTAQNPTHTYAAVDVYAVSLTVTTLVGSHSITRANLITVNALRGPTAAFSADHEEGEIPLTVTFTDESEPGSKVIWSWAWDFGDGATATVPNPSHTYTDIGVYAVSLTVTTAVGSDTHTSPALIHTKDVSPTAGFVPDTYGGIAPLSVHFTDNSVAESEPITRWDWDFGDGATSTEHEPTHVYTVAGNYTVSLTITTRSYADTYTLDRSINVVAAR